MKNSKPFSLLLDIYYKECAILYDVVKSLLKYPSIQPNADLEGKLYASAFASICSQFLEVTQDMYPQEDFSLFVKAMEFKKEDFEFFKKGLSTETLDYVPESFDELVFAILQDYQKTIKKDLRKVYQTDEKLAAFFCAIFTFDDADYMQEMTMDSIDFLREFK